MTKYVLDSGGLRKNPEKAREFFAEVLKDLGAQPRVLFCFFASGREYWEVKMAEYMNRFQKMSPEGIKPSFELALPDSFAEQMATSDAIMLFGGDDTLLQYWLRQFDITTIWNNKVVAGSSAGSDALCAHFWTCDWRKCMDGLGMLHIKFIPHYESDFGSLDPRGPINWRAALDELKQYGDRNLSIHALKEGEYIVIEQ